MDVVLARRMGRIAAAVPAVALLIMLAHPASAGSLPAPSSDYETEALDMCADGDLECVRSTLDDMRQHTRQLAQDCDHDAIFAALYTVVTTYYYETVADDSDFFDDTAFVNHEDAVFAHYYFWPYVNRHEGLAESVPPAWEVAFKAADSQQVSAVGNLLLGINAHVVRDLPFVLARLGMGSKADHDRVNDILRAASERAIAVIDDHLADSIDDANVDGTTLDDEALFQVVASWREQAWQDARALSTAVTSLERAVIAAEIEQKAHVQAQELRAQYSYPSGSDAVEQRNRYCAQQSWPPAWLG